MHHKKSFNRNAVKKNGPLTWDSLNDDLIEGFNTDNTQQITRPLLYNTKINNSIEKSSNNSNRYKELSESSSNNHILSDNQKSPTFRSVGPHMDSTVNYQGQK